MTVLTLFSENAVNWVTLGGVQDDHVPHLCLVPLPRPPEVVFVLGPARVRTWGFSSRDPNLHHFTQSVKNGQKWGDLPVFDREIECTSLGGHFRLGGSSNPYLSSAGAIFGACAHLWTLLGGAS